MNLVDLIHRVSPPEPWAEGDKIPWHDPAFSRRMLREHLSQAHDAASRRSIIIEEHVAWIQREVLQNRPGRVLDLGCGPGLYSSRLAQRGHTCVGIDFSPASIEYARAAAQSQQLACEYRLADLRHTEYGSGYDLAMFIFGELNVFRPEEARRILHKAYAALNEGGRLLLEVSTFAAVQQQGHQRSTWYTLGQGLFSDRPHVCLFESFWDEARAVAIERFYIIDAETNEVTPHSISSQANTDEQYRRLVQDAGFTDITFYPSLIGRPDERQKDFEEQGMPWGILRYKQTQANLAKHRQGTIARAFRHTSIPLAGRGHFVQIVDYSEQMLGDAMRRAVQANLQDRIAVHKANVQEVSSLFPDSHFDVVLCHNVLQYIEDVPALLKSLALPLKANGLISLISINRYSLPYHAAFLRSDLAAAFSQLDARQMRAITFDTVMTNYSVDEIRDMLDGASCQIEQDYGLRCLCDYWGDHERKLDPAIFEQLERLEYALTDRYPYKLLARYYQVIARKR